MGYDGNVIGFKSNKKVMKVTAIFISLIFLFSCFSRNAPQPESQWMNELRKSLCVSISDSSGRVEENRNIRFYEFSPVEFAEKTCPQSCFFIVADYRFSSQKDAERQFKTEIQKYIHPVEAIKEPKYIYKFGQHVYIISASCNYDQYLDTVFKYFKEAINPSHKPVPENSTIRNYCGGNAELK